VSKPFTIEIPWPGKGCDPNARVHWRKKAKDVATSRRAAWAECIRQPGHCRGWKAARVNVAAFHKTARMRDSQNIIACLKGAIDGVEDSGLLEDDAGLEWGIVDRQKDAANPRIVLTFTEVEDGQGDEPQQPAKSRK
jgi:Holliday junction resolvase RusA-like endonuclease